MAAIDEQMDSWINRCRSFAEGVVVMVSPVLLAFALTKVNLTLKDHGRALPITMLVVAAITLVAGIGPFLAFSLSKFWSAPNQVQIPEPPRTVTKWLAPICSACLVVLACWIMSLIIYSNKASYVTGAVLMGVCIIARSVQYCLQPDDANLQGNDDYKRLENSLECLAGITGFLFLGLESLALESYVSGQEEAQRRLTATMVVSFWVCVVGVFTMLLATIPPTSRFSTGNLTAVFDVVVGGAVSLVMFFLMYAVVEVRALIVMAPGFLCLLVYVFYVAKDAGSSGGAIHNQVHEPPAASLELTKVTFVGFLAVSIPSISKGSVDTSTEWFIHLAAAAIVSGLIWRLLTHLESAAGGIPKDVVNVVSIVTHSCIVIATVPFAIMAGKALPATATALAPAPIF